MEDNDEKFQDSPIKKSPHDSLPRNAINPVILDYYKKFGRKRDLEQYFSLSTAQSDIQDPSSEFWKSMKSEIDSSDSGEKKSESSTEICRISITCSVPEPQQDSSRRLKSDSESPPIISEEIQIEELDTSKYDNETVKSDNESGKSDGNQSQESVDATLDTSINKPQSPTSSITSQRRLEWDSLADVGYANETDRKTSASSLSTLERFALRQQYSNSQDNVGEPTAQSTPVEESSKSKGKKSLVKKTKIFKKDCDVVELNVPQGTTVNPTPFINVNLTKHISFNVEKDGAVNIEDMKRDVSVNSSSAKPASVTDSKPISKENTAARTDKEIQTSLPKTKDKNYASESAKRSQFQRYGAAIPVLINLNTLKRRQRQRKIRTAKRKLKCKRKPECVKENLPVLEKSGEQVSEAESFEYMPGHIYNQNHLENATSRSANTAGNKSSLESSAVTDSSVKISKQSFSKDLDKGINLLRTALDKRYDDNKLKTKLVREVVRRLIKSKYKDDESSTDFLSGLSFNSKAIGMSDHNYTTTSTSDPNNSGSKVKVNRPKKSILRTEQLNPKVIASTSQSAPNLNSLSKPEKLASNIRPTITSNTDSEMSSKEKNSSDGISSKKTSQELYLQYVKALKKEQTYKNYLKDKELFLKQKLTSSEPPKLPLDLQEKTGNKLKELMNDLTRNNYDDGSGDASKLEGHIRRPDERFVTQKKFRSHSVYTLSSGNSGNVNNTRKSNQNSQYPHCSLHSQNVNVCNDNGVQVDIRDYCSENNSAYTSRSWPYGQNICNTEIRNQSNRNIEKLQPAIPNIRSISSKIPNSLCAQCNCSQSKVSSLTHNTSRPSSPSKFISKACSPRPASPCSPRRNMPCSPRATSPCSPKSSSTSPRSPRKPCSPQPSTSKAHLKSIIKNSVCKSSSTGSSCNFPLHKCSKTSQTDLNICLKNVSRKTSGNSIPTCSKNSCRTHNVIYSDQNLVHEAIRWIQTEISIDPKISDPCISDIIIINDCDCVKVVKEQYRLVSNKNSTAGSLNSTESEAQKMKIINLCKSSESSRDSTKQYIKDQVAKVMTREGGIGHSQYEDKTMSCSRFRSSKAIQYEMDDEASVGKKSGQYTIPIKGTNMMLMVNIGTDDKEITSDKYNFSVNQGVCTNKITLFEKHTSLTEECTKGVQCESSFNGNERHSTISSKNKCTNCQTTRDKCSCEYNSKSNRKSLKKCVQCKQLLEDCSCNKNTSSLQNVTNKCSICRKACEYCSCGVKESVRRPTSGRCSMCQKDCDNCTCETKNKNNSKRCALCNDPYEDCACEMNGAFGSSDAKKCFQCNRVRGNCICETRIETNTIKCTQCKQACKDCSCDVEEANPRNIPRRCSQCQRDCDNCSCEQINKVYSKKCSICQKACESCSCKQQNYRLCGICKNACSVCTCDDKTSNTGLLSGDLMYDFPKSCQDSGSYISENRSVSPHKETRFDNRCMSQYSNTYPRPKSQQATCTGVIKKGLSVQTDVISCKDADTQKEEEIYYVEKQTETEAGCSSNEAILDVIRDITKRYSKTDLKKSKKNKCFKELMTVLNYLLDTEQNIDQQYIKEVLSSTSKDTDCSKVCSKNNSKSSTCKDSYNTTSERECRTKKTFDKGVITDQCCDRPKPKNIWTQRSRDVSPCGETCPPPKKQIDKGICTEECTKNMKIKRVCNVESSGHITTEVLGTSTDSATCRVLNRIKKECDRYHQKRCKSYTGKKCDPSSSTSVTCEECKRVHQCACRNHRCKGHKSKIVTEKTKNKCVAYNLIIQTSDSMISEETPHERQCRQLKNIVIRAPSRCKDNIPFKEMATKIEEKQYIQKGPSFIRINKTNRSRSWPYDSDSGEFSKSKCYTVRDYLEKNRPDFIEKTSERQNCLKYISQSRVHEDCAAQQLKMVVVHTPNCAGGSRTCNMYCGGVPMNCSSCHSACMQTLQNEVTKFEQTNVRPKGNCCRCRCSSNLH